MLLLSACTMAASCSPRHIPDGAQKIYNERYGQGKRNVLDFFLPKDYTPNSTVVLLIHGGAWMVGNKTHLRPVQNMLFNNNIPTAAMNYTLVNAHHTYLDQLADVDKAVKKTLEFAEKHHLNSKKVILLGESSGAHIALLYGYRHPELVEKIVSLSAPTDLYSEKYRSTNYYKRSHKVFMKVAGVKNFNEAALREASPIMHVNDVPTLIFQGTKDLLVDKTQGLALDSAMTARGYRHKTVIMDNAGHLPRFFRKNLRDTLIYPNILSFIKEDKNY